jgi:hypothetical protein
MFLLKCNLEDLLDFTMGILRREGREDERAFIDLGREMEREW